MKSSTIHLESCNALDIKLTWNNCFINKASFYVLFWNDCFSATLLLRHLLVYLTSDDMVQCKAVYLHVMASNTSAIEFYEMLSFQLHSRLSNYYSIKGDLHDGYLYVLYINGGQAPSLLWYPLQDTMSEGPKIRKGSLLCMYVPSGIGCLRCYTGSWKRFSQGCACHSHSCILLLADVLLSCSYAAPLNLFYDLDRADVGKSSPFPLFKHL